MTWPPDVLVDSPGGLAAALARQVESIASAAIAARGSFTLALTGGSTASVCYPALATAAIDWRHVSLFWSDERAVPPDHAESNYRLAHDLLIARLPAPPGAVHRMPGEAPDLQGAAAAYEADLIRALGVPPRLDLVLLGVGPDGHVCSLFPGHPALQERSRWVVGITDAPKPPPRRLSFTLPALAAARRIIMAAFGASKAAVVRDTFESPRSTLPVAIAARSGPKVGFLLDLEAAGRLPPG